jgi:hypothetical protein
VLKIAFQPIDIASISSYGATRTTTFTTTITAIPDQRTFASILFPSSSVTEPLQYTAFHPLVDQASKSYPSFITDSGRHGGRCYNPQHEWCSDINGNIHPTAISSVNSNSYLGCTASHEPRLFFLELLDAC